MAKSFTTQALAKALDGQLIGDGTLEVTRLAHPADVRGGGDLVLAMDAKLLPLLETTTAKAAVVGKNANLKSGHIQARIVVSRPRLAMAQLTNLFAEAVPVIEGIHPTAVIEKGAQLGAHVSVGALAYVGAGAVIGDGSVVHPQCYIGPGAVIGRNALIYSGVRIGSAVTLGERCIIHFNASIGADGFSFVTPEPGSVEQVKAGSDKVTATNQHIVRIASLGGVLIGNDVEIGANSCIDQGTIRPTRVGNGTKIDNHVQIGHNVSIGDNCLICGRVGIAGSATIGNRVVLGGAVGVADHVKVGDDVVAMAMAGIAGNAEPGSVVGGMPARPREKMLETYLNVSRLKHFYSKIEALSERFDRFEQKSKD